MTSGRPTLSGSTRIAGVVGSPARHSLSPLIHNAWLEAAGLDGLYMALEVEAGRFEHLVEGLRGGSVAGLNVTLPFKARALALADIADEAARRSGAANLLLLHPDGQVEARNTDGLGLLAAFAEQAPDTALDSRPIVVVGAGGAASGAVAALIQAGAPEVRILNRTLARAMALAALYPGRAGAYELCDAREALSGAAAIINATSVGLNDTGALRLPLDVLSHDAAVMDMVYKPLETALLAQARSRGLGVVDGLAMLVGQAAPSFEALFGAPVPTSVDVRKLAIGALEGA